MSTLFLTGLQSVAPVPGGGAPALALPAFQAALAATKAGTRDTRVLMVSDSTATSLGATGWYTGWVPQLARMIRANTAYACDFGLVAPTWNWGTGSGANNGHDPRWRDLGNPWTNAAFGFGNAAGFSTTGNQPCLYTPSNDGTTTPRPIQPVDTFRVYYLRQPGGGTFKLNASGLPDAGAVPYSTAGGYGIGVATIVCPLAAVDNSAAFFPVGDGTVTLLGCEASNSSQRRILLGCAGVPGARTISWTGDAAAGGQAANGLAAIKAYAPDLTIIPLGKNDGDDQPGSGLPAPSVATYLSRMGQIGDAASISGSVIVSTQSPSSGGTRPANEAAYAAALPSWCAGRGYGFVDVFGKAFGGTYDALRMDSAMPSGTVHDNDYGYCDEAAYRFGFLKPYLL